MENTTLTRYKNSHPHCHSRLRISSKNLFRWKDSSCSQSTLCLEHESPSQMGSGAGAETGPDPVRLTGTVKQLAGADPPLCLCSGPLQQGSEADFGVQVALRGFPAALREGSPQKGTSWPPAPHCGLGSLQVLSEMMQAFPVSASPTEVPPGLTVTQGKGKPCRSTSSHPCSTILCSVNLYPTSRHSAAPPQDGAGCASSCVPLSLDPTTVSEC